MCDTGAPYVNAGEERGGDGLVMEAMRMCVEASWDSRESERS